MTPKYSQICDDPKNIHKIFIPQKIFIFLKTPQKIETQNFEPQKNDRSLRIYENIRVPPPPPPPPWDVTIPWHIDRV